MLRTCAFVLEASNRCCTFPPEPDRRHCSFHRSILLQALLHEAETQERAASAARLRYLQLLSEGTLP